MSSKGRSAPPKEHEHEYYVTPQNEIRKFLKAWDNDTGIVSSLKGNFAVLDPCAGGSAKDEMSYPPILNEFGINPTTMDIRSDSRADIIGNYLNTDAENQRLIITNPPFSLARQIVDKALNDTVDGGYVVMLLRLNYFGTQDRFEWWQKNMPERAYVHSKRMGFKPWAPGKTDSIEYMHAVWCKGYYPKETKLKVIL